MNGEETISHQAIVTECAGDHATLSLLSTGDCHECHLKSLCKMEGDTTLSVPMRNFHVGDMVRVSIRPSQVLIATLWAYLAPSLVVISVLIIGTMMSVSDLLLSAMSLGALIPYFLIVAIARAGLKSRMKLQIEKL